MIPEPRYRRRTKAYRIVPSDIDLNHKWDAKANYLFYSFHISQELPPISTATNSGGWNHKHQWSAECTVWRYVIHRWFRLLPFTVRPSVPGTIQPFKAPYVWTVPQSRDLLSLHPSSFIELSHTWWIQFYFVKILILLRNCRHHTHTLGRPQFTYCILVHDPFQNFAPPVPPTPNDGSRPLTADERDQITLSRFLIGLGVIVLLGLVFFWCCLAYPCLAAAARCLAVYCSACFTCLMCRHVIKIRKIRHV